MALKRSWNGSEWVTVDPETAKQEKKRQDEIEKNKDAIQKAQETLAELTGESPQQKEKKERIAAFKKIIAEAQKELEKLENS